MEENIRQMVESFHRGDNIRAYELLGCHRETRDGQEGWVFRVWAPNARFVSVIGDFNFWNKGDLPMEKISQGVWEVFSQWAREGSTYKYYVVGADGREVDKTDPYGFRTTYRPDNCSIVCDIDRHKWQDGRYLANQKRRNVLKRPMNIYEMHFGSWRRKEGNVPYGYAEIADQLIPYLQEMGYTHVELMPITEYPYDPSWGYQVTGYFAATSRYGNPDDLKYFVDQAHQRGIGVIMDWVPAHFPKDEHGLANFDGTPLYECKERRMAEHPEWGTLIFDYASSQVQSFLVSSACKFFEVFHIDGIRVDAVSSMLYLNYGRRDGEFTPNEEGGSTNLHALRFLRKMNSAILSNYPGTVTIAEESTAFPLITAPPDVGGVGFCLKWDMGFMHDTIDYMQMDPLFRSFHHNKLTFSMMYAFSENYVLAYSHDEVVHGKYSMINKMSGDYEQKFASLRALYGYQFGHPGKKLTFMGSEFGQFIEWNWKQGLDWLLLGFRKHEQLRQYMRELNKLYTSTPALYAVDRSWDGFKWLNVDDAGRSSIAFLRSAAEEDSYVVCVSNFTPIRYDNFLIGLPQNGSLHEILNSDDERFGGTGVKNPPLVHAHKKPFLDMQYSANITLPPLSTVFFRYKPRKKKKN